ncbi:MAG: tRNA (adenosine(37)-N6)-threonylcarbamoyltransferase complex transferase subunit TsaD [Spirochaetia bacterium]
MITLGVESSCDELAMAILESGQVLARVVTSQITDHQPFQGVVPEIASRLHIEQLIPTFKKLFSQTSLTVQDLDLVACTNRPGLVGSLLVGLCFSKSLAWGLGCPFIAVDHIKAHWYVNHLVHSTLQFPYLAVVVSGGHTLLYHVVDLENIHLIGRTIDDAIGECYDKVAKFYHLGYPGGPIIDQMARDGNQGSYHFPYANLYKGQHRYDISYSGLKNAVTNQAQQFHKKGMPDRIEDLLASFQKVAVGMLISKIKKALTDYDLSCIVLGGGVSANTYLQQQVQQLKGIESFYPPLSLCGDNAEMIAFLGQRLFAMGEISTWDIAPKNRIVTKGL